MLHATPTLCAPRARRAPAHIALCFARNSEGFGKNGKWENYYLEKSRILIQFAIFPRAEPDRFPGAMPRLASAAMPGEVAG